MKILIAESTTAMGGQELAVLLHARGLQRRGHDVHLVLEPGSPIYRLATAQGFQVDGVRMRRTRYPAAIVSFARLLLQQRPDILHVNSSRDSWIGALAARLVPHRPKVVRSRHISNPLNRSLATRLLYRRLFDRVIVTGSELTRRALVERDGLRPERVAAFPIGVDVGLFCPGVPQRNLRVDLGLDAGHRLVGIVSYLRKYKGHVYLVDAAARLLARRRDVTFVIVGEGPEEADIRARIAQHGIEEGVKVMGFRPDLLDVFRSLDVFVIPTIEADTIPQVLMQALALGLPVVSTPVGSIPDVVHDGVTGLLVPPRDAAGLAAAIERLLDDDGLRRALGAAGHALVRDRYSLDAMLDLLEEVYRGVVRNVGVMA
ncbi:glycosyltransferase family 4 protein [Candidatus Nitrospira bockiana]